MALLHRISSILSDHGPSTQVIERPAAARFHHPHGVFAALETDPPEKADEAYGVFIANALTPGIAEREIRELLMHASPVCAPLECVPSFAWEFGRESTDIGRMRVFSHYLVHLQLLHESNANELHQLLRMNVKRVRLMPGCCDVCDRLAGRSYRVTDAPLLPARGCLRHGGCNCAFVPVVD
ncbi:MAG TPA: hypothetical protein VMM78_11240 [Thermomicrobiales bacterium]|nr:hypothetical protein [Thermomicrobiales bacterium]